MNYKNLLNSDTGRIVISILLGLGVACLFHKVCKDKDCINFAGPIINKVDGKIFQHDGKCYTYKARAVKCNPSKKTVHFDAELPEEKGMGLPSLSSLSSSSFIPSFFTPAT
jgi:hypothetical protein